MSALVTVFHIAVPAVCIGVSYLLSAKSVVTRNTR